MNYAAFLLVAQVLMGLALGYSCFCRLTKTNDDTVREIRWSIWFEGVTGLLVAGAPFVPLLVPEVTGWPPWTTPMWLWIALLAGATMVQVATSRLWRFNVPEDFQSRGFLP